MAEVTGLVPDVSVLRQRLDDAGYIADDGLATALFCAVRLPQALLLEGEPGVGKTEAAKALAAALGTVLVRLQCYEGIDAAEALYEWNYPRQLLAIRLAEARASELAESDLFGRDYLVKRPLL
ncbi:MAG TPA: AAA family ATPase, partial [Acidimicrobiia bacterium]|nr:AAA family ATPase [Acidimicrobiia bacterium]